MKVVDFIAELANFPIDDKVIKTTKRQYSFTGIPRITQQLLTKAADGIFFEEGCKLLSFDDILSASRDLNVNFSRHGIIPLFDIGDNNYIVYNFKKNTWELFNIVESETFKSAQKINDIINNIYGVKQMSKIELSEEIVQQIADITTQYAPEGWVMIAIEAIMSNNNLSFNAEALDTDDMQYEITIDDEDQRLLTTILLGDMRKQSYSFFRFELNDDGDYSIEFA